ncbi:hypothetical protein C8T65DRAFT_635338 [Cerioporus squamosus]|nr:hypothetical protein C8T65DRAFT_635338 [Cerioporus squamosus]
MIAQSISDNSPSPKPEEGYVSESVPFFIEDVMNRRLRPREQRGSLRPLEKRTMECLMIDVDNAAILDARPMVEDKNLANRTGTPLYIARSVCIGQPREHEHSLRGVPMPTLTGEAKLLYVQAYGQSRYDRFAEKNPFTCHGAIPPSTHPDPLPAFVHRPCHDAESIFWTMLAALLRAQPVSGTRESWAPKKVAELWKKLHDHEIPDDPAEFEDQRESIFYLGPLPWARYFHPEMRDVARLLYDIRKQVAPEYEYWTPRPPDDHLHEAMQRLILQYLVDHRHKDIPLDPDNLRPTEAQPPVDKNKTVNTQTGSRHTGSRTSTTSKSGEPTVVDPKRKSGSQGGRDSKRLKGLLGSPVPIDEVEEED